MGKSIRLDRLLIGVLALLGSAALGQVIAGDPEPALAASAAAPLPATSSPTRTATRVAIQTPTISRTSTPRPTNTPRSTNTLSPTRTTTPTRTPRLPTPTPTAVPELNWTSIHALPSRSGPLLVAYYYPWYDARTWTSRITPDQPAQPYISADPAVMERHIGQAQGAGIDVFNVAWLGPGNPTDANLARMLPIAAAHGFDLTVGFETDSPFLSSQSDFVQALRYALARYAAQPGYLRYEGKPVLFFWRPRAIPLDGLENPVAAWHAVRDAVDPNGDAIWIAEGDRFEFLEVFDGIYPYSVAWSPDVDQTLRLYAARTRRQAENLNTSKLWVAGVMPGYDDRLTGRSDAFTRDRATGRFYGETWRAAVGTRPDWIMIVSWNEWVEGTQIEPSRSYGNQYLNTTRAAVSAWKSAVADGRAAPPIRGSPAEAAPPEAAVGGIARQDQPEALPSENRALYRPRSANCSTR